MTENKFKKLIQTGELAREKGDYKTALACFDEVMLLAGQSDSWKHFTKALGHKLVITKHFWQTTKDNGFLELIQADVELGLRICKIKKLAKRYLAVFQLRMGDILVARKEYKHSIFWFRKAVRSLADTEKNSGYSEYLRHLGMGLALAGQNKKAEQILLKSQKILKQDKSIRKFHKLSLEVGVLSWLAFATRKRKPEESKKLFKNAITVAKELKKEYNMPMRLKQLKTMKAELGL